MPRRRRPAERAGRAAGAAQFGRLGLPGPAQRHLPAAARHAPPHRRLRFGRTRPGNSDSKKNFLLVFFLIVQLHRMGCIGLGWLKLVFGSLEWVLLGYNGLYWVRIGYSGLERVLMGCTGFW